MKFYWTVPNSDDFTTATEWTPHGEPGPSDQALLTATGTAYDVNVLGGESLTVLTISTSADAILNIIQNSTFTALDGTGAGANNGSIQVSDGSTFKVSGTFNNNGTIAVNSGMLQLISDTTLNGGELLFGTSTLLTGTSTLTNTGNSTIEGSGTLFAPIVNTATGVIDGNGTVALIIEAPLVTNTGKLIGEYTARHRHRHQSSDEYRDDDRCEWWHTLRQQPFEQHWGPSAGE